MNRELVRLKDLVRLMITDKKYLGILWDFEPAELRSMYDYLNKLKEASYEKV